MGSKRVVYARLQIEIDDQEEFTRHCDLMRVPPGLQGDEPMVMPWSDEHVILMLATAALNHANVGVKIVSPQPLPPDPRWAALDQDWTDQGR